MCNEWEDSELNNLYRMLQQARQTADKMIWEFIVSHDKDTTTSSSPPKETE